MAVLAVTNDQHARCKRAAEIAGQTLSAWTSQAINEALKNHMVQSPKVQGQWQSPRRRQVLSGIGQ